MKMYIETSAICGESGTSELPANLRHFPRYVTRYSEYKSDIAIGVLL